MDNLSSDQIFSDHSRDVCYWTGPNWIDVCYQGHFIHRIFLDVGFTQPVLKHLENILNTYSGDMAQWQRRIMAIEDPRPKRKRPQS